MRSTDGAAATCEGLVKVYRAAATEVFALRGVDLHVPAARVTAVVGPSGSGKSSLLRILAALDLPTAGAVTIAGVELAGLDDAGLRRLRRSALAYVFQRPTQNLVPHLSVRDHVVHAQLVRGRAGDDDPDALIDALGLGHCADRRPDGLSGGEQQRLAFAQAAIGRPTLVVADEPTAELDRASADALLAAVRELTGRGTAVVVATHDDRVVHAADRVVHLHDGTVRAELRRGHADDVPRAGSGELLTVLDSTGRLQLPAELLDRFPDRRARLVVAEDGVWITPP